MKTMMKRLVAWIIAGVMILSFAACSSDEGQQDKGSEESQTSTEQLFEPGTEISMAVGSHPSWPYDENWNMWRYFREATGVNFQVQAIPNTDILTKVNLMMASPDTLPDLIYLDGKLPTDDFAKQGALIAIDDYLDIMPNYTKFWDSIPEEERKARLDMRKSYDGKTYFPQNYGTDSRQGIRAWMYRKDIFEKHNLEVPTTMDELYTVAKKLKELYPNSYPFCQREGLRNIGVMGSQWKPYFTWELYYDFDNEQWNYGAIEPTMLEIVTYMRKLYEEELLPPEYLTGTVKTWEELMSTDRGFITADFVVRIDNFNNVLRNENPDYTLAAMVPPVPDTDTASTKVNKFNVDTKGYTICNTGNQERIENAIRLVDWMYSDEAAELLSWGKEGETYEVIDGERHFIRPENGDIEGAYGVFSYGTYLRVDPDAAIDIASEEQQAGIKIALENTIENYNPWYWISLADEEKTEYDQLNDSIQTYVEENLSKFLTLQKPLSEWDAYVQGVKDLGIDRVIEIYDIAYQRVTQ